MMRCLWFLALGACVFHAGTSPNAGSDGGIDGKPPIDGSNAAACYGTAPNRVCFSAVPTGMKPVQSAINTDAGCSTSVVSGPDACVIAADSIVVSGTIKVTGSKPLILLAVGTITISNGALIDVASHRMNNVVGAGANTGCVAPGNPQLAAGGAGGSFHGRGGAGGSAGGSSGGTPAATISATTLRGGCAGGVGSTGGPAGDGGGGIGLIAATIKLDGDINASGGAGGVPGSGVHGGSGGGSGGMILLDAGSILGTGTLVANGGGGSGGSSNGMGAGQEADPANPNTRASGGSGVNSSDGGDGSAGTTLDGGPGVGDGLAGGGGGGGAGLIHLANATTFSGTASPPTS